MNSKVFGTINAASWAVGDEIGRQFDVLNGIARGKEGGVVDVCNLCKNEGDVKMSPDSIITVDRGCRCQAKDAPNITSGAGIVDVADLGNDGSTMQARDELRYDMATEEQQNVGGDYVEQDPTTAAIVENNNKPTIYMSENDTIAPSDVQPVELAPVEQVEPEQVPVEEVSTEQPAESVDIVGVDDGAVEKFCSGHMSPIEYSINITIIILFIAISLTAILMIFKLAKKCSKYDCCEYDRVKNEPPIFPPAEKAYESPKPINQGFSGGNVNKPTVLTGNIF